MDYDHFDLDLLIPTYPAAAFVLWIVSGTSSVCSAMLDSVVLLISPSTLIQHVICIPLSINHAIHRRTNRTELLMKEAQCIQILCRWHRLIFSGISVSILTFSFILWLFGYHVPLLLHWYLWYGRLLNVVHLAGYWITKGTNQMHRYQTLFGQAAHWMLQKVWKFWTKSHYLYHSELVWNRLRSDMDAHDETLRVLGDGLIANDDSIPNEISNLIAEYAFNGHIRLMSAQRAMCRSLRALHLPTAAVHEANKLTFPERERNLMVRMRHRGTCHHSMGTAHHSMVRLSGQLSACMGSECFNYQPIGMRIFYRNVGPTDRVNADFEYDWKSKELIPLCHHCGLRSEDPTAVERSDDDDDDELS